MAYENPRRGVIRHGRVNGFPYDETANYYWVRIKSPSRYSDFVQKEISPGVRLVLGRRPDGALEVQSVSFSKSRFRTISQVRSWLRKYEDRFRRNPEDDDDSEPEASIILCCDLKSKTMFVSVESEGEPKDTISASYSDNRELFNVLYAIYLLRRESADEDCIPLSIEEYKAALDDDPEKFRPFLGKLFRYIVEAKTPSSIERFVARVRVEPD